MARERKAWRERRMAHYLLKTGQTLRRAPTDLESAALFRAINYRDLNAFGIRNLVNLELNHLYPPPVETLVAGIDLEARLTVMSYAAWRRRHAFVKKLITAGASATVSERAPLGAFVSAEESNRGESGGAGEEQPQDERLVQSLLSSLPGAAAVFLVEQVVRLRQLFVRAGHTTGGAPCAVCSSDRLLLRLEPCGCVCCEPCLWRGLCEPPTGIDRGDIFCPNCGATPPVRSRVATCGAAVVEEVSDATEALVASGAVAAAAVQATDQPQTSAAGQDATTAPEAGVKVEEVVGAEGATVVEESRMITEWK
jgi:hypothetical protein